MNCAEARGRMLVADPSFLQGQEVGSGDLEAADRRLVEHLEGCASCRGRARVVAEGQRKLARALDAAATEMDGAPVPLLESPMAEGGETSVGAGRPERPGDVGREGGAGTSSGPRWWTAAAGAALATAAALALWLVPGDPDLTNGASSPVVEIQGASGAGGFELEAPSAGDVAVFRTTEPDVIVVWRLAEGGGS